MRSLRFVSILLVLSLATVAQAVPPEPEFVPISQEALTDDLVQAGYHNGDMPAIRMMEVGACLLERDAAYTLSLMLEAARADGIDLVAQECYRSYGSQAAAYERRCPVEEEDIVRVDPETGVETIVGVKKSRSCSGPPLAQPGRSNHGWGRAVDFGNGRRVLSCRDAGLIWLQENGASFGWVHPDWAHCGRATREPWHWEWGGVTEALPLPPVLRTFNGSDTRVR